METQPTKAANKHIAFAVVASILGFALVLGLFLIVLNAINSQLSKSEAEQSSSTNSVSTTSTPERVASNFTKECVFTEVGLKVKVPETWNCTKSSAMGGVVSLGIAAGDGYEMQLAFPNEGLTNRTMTEFYTNGFFQVSLAEDKEVNKNFTIEGMIEGVDVGDDIDATHIVITYPNDKQAPSVEQTTFLHGLLDNISLL